MITIFSIILVSHTTVSKYKSSSTYKQVMPVASPIFKVEGTETSKISAINNIGYYEFIVKNYNETQVSETGFEYTIEIVSTPDEAIKFELYNGETQIPLENLKTGKLTISGKDKTEQQYELKVTYDKNKGSSGKDILEDIQVKIHSEQAKIG